MEKKIAPSEQNARSLRERLKLDEQEVSMDEPSSYSRSVCSSSSSQEGRRRSHPAFTQRRLKNSGFINFEH